jgi:hypothetical protein
MQKKQARQVKLGGPAGLHEARFMEGGGCVLSMAKVVVHACWKKRSSASIRQARN